MGRKTISITEDLYNAVIDLYPNLNWTERVEMLLNVATRDDVTELKNKFSTVLTQLIDKNNLQR